MVGDDRGRNHRKLAGAPAIEDIDEAMVELRYQQHHAPPGGAVAHLPVHVEAFGDGGKAGLQRRKFDREIGRSEHHAHEELVVLDVGELLGIEDVLAVMGQERRNRRHDAGTIGAGQRQHILMIGHGAA